MSHIKIITDFAGLAPDRILALELLSGTTVLSERIRSGAGGEIIAAISANGRWGYEKEGRRWVIIDKTRGDALLAYEASLLAARRLTFETDHPVHTVPREPKPVRWSF